MLFKYACILVALLVFSYCNDSTTNSEANHGGTLDNESITSSDDSSNPLNWSVIAEKFAEKKTTYTLDSLFLNGSKYSLFKDNFSSRYMYFTGSSFIDIPEFPEGVRDFYPTPTTQIVTHENNNEYFFKYLSNDNTYYVEQFYDYMSGNGVILKDTHDSVQIYSIANNGFARVIKDEVYLLGVRDKPEFSDYDGVNFDLIRYGGYDASDIRNHPDGKIWNQLPNWFKPNNDDNPLAKQVWDNYQDIPNQGGLQYKDLVVTPKNSIYVFGSFDFGKSLLFKYHYPNDLQYGENFGDYTEGWVYQSLEYLDDGNNNFIDMFNINEEVYILSYNESDNRFLIYKSENDSLKVNAVINSDIEGFYFSKSAFPHFHLVVEGNNSIYIAITYTPDYDYGNPDLDPITPKEYTVVYDHNGVKRFDTKQIDTDFYRTSCIDCGTLAYYNGSMYAVVIEKDTVPNENSWDQDVVTEYYTLLKKK